MEAKTILGQAIRTIRESRSWSQAELGDRAGITYQYLSALENGKENFTIGILEAVCTALNISVPKLVNNAYIAASSMPEVNAGFFVRKVILPPGLTIDNIRETLNETHRVIRLINTVLISESGRPLQSYVQANNFSGIVSNILCDSFSNKTPFKHNNDQRYPDLVNLDNPTSRIGLEVKCTINVGKGGESHNGHEGWHVVACFNIDDQTGDICFVHVMIAFLNGHNHASPDWKYQGSNVNEATGSRRTETYMTTSTGTTKLRHGTVYLDRDLINISRWRIDKEVEIPEYSPFRKD